MAENAELRFLIAGTARSGTTLVQRLVCELPGVWVPPETHFWSHAEVLASEFDWPVQGDDRLRVVERALQLSAGGELPVTSAAVMQQVAARNRRTGLWTLFESIVGAMSPPDRTVLGEKTPNHLFWWEQLAEAVPLLRFVVVVRDPRDVLRSHRSVPWGERDAHALAERWLLHQRAAFDARRILGGDRVLLLRYEDVTSDPAGAQTQLAGLLGVPDAPAPLDESLLARHPLFPEREEWKSRALEAVSTEPRQRGELGEDDAAVIESVCGGSMAAMRYSVPAAPATGLPPEGESLDRVQAFRRWCAGVAAADDVPIY
ncbi:MAG: sulfotransferase [Actinobacteria bacterium]|nr:sulfotransferase [Actinomycetota bacterium]